MQTITRQTTLLPVSRLAFIALLSTCLSLIACAEPNSPSPVEEERFVGIETVESATATGHPDPVTDTQAANMPRQGGVLVIEVDECGIADPAVDVAGYNRLSFFTLVNETHVGLTRIVTEPSTAAEPELAESFTVREGGILYEFTMRKELKFSDGSRLTASDVKWSWERALRKSTSNSRANDVFGDIVGAEAVVLGDSQDLVGVQIVDENRLTVRLQAPRPDFPMLIADPVAYVVSRENVDDWGDAWVNDEDFPGEISYITGIIPKNLPLGAGPFKIVEYAHPDTTREGLAGESRCVLERNEHYWGEPSRLDGIVANVRQDLWDIDATFNRQKELLHSGALDIVTYISLEPGDMDELPVGTQQYQEKELPNVEFLTLNPAQQPLDNIHLRRALVKANNVGAAMRTINGAPNQRRIVPESVYVNGSDVSELDFDIESAKSELDTFMESVDLDEIELPIYSSVPPEFVFGGVVQSAMFDVWSDALGISVDLQQLDLDNPVRFEELHITQGEINLYYPSPHGVLLEFLHVMGDNNTAPEIVKIREAIYSAASILDDAERLLRYEEIERRIINDALVIPIMALDPHIDLLVQPWVKGLSSERYSHSVFHNIWLRSDAPLRTTQ